MTKIWFVIDSLGGGGAERSTAVLLPHLRNRGLHPSVVTLYSSETDSEDELRSQGFEIHRLASDGYPGRVRELHRLLRAHEPEVLHTSLYASDQIGRLASIGTSARVVSSLVNVPRRHRQAEVSVPLWKRATVDGIDRLTGRYLVDEFHAVTQGVAKLAVDGGDVPAGKVSVVERGRDPSSLGERSESRCQRVRSSLSIAEDAEVVLALGRQVPQKDYPTLLRAVSLLADDRPALVTLIAGKAGPASSQISGMIEADPRLGDRVQVLGHRSDVGDLLACADLLALSSKFEGAAGVLLEAMALRTPIVATRLPGLEGVLVDGKNCLTVPVGDHAALASAIDKVLNDDDLVCALTTEARRDFDDRFTIEVVAHRMAELYERVITRPRHKVRGASRPDG